MELLLNGELGRPSAWVMRWAPLVSPGATVLDLACGSGRHLSWWAARGHPVTGVDRDAVALASLKQGIATLRTIGQPESSRELIEADLEAAPWPLAGRQFGVVIVTNYLWRPLFNELVSAVEPGGWLLYETFSQGQAAFGRPTRSDFLLQPGELLQRCGGLRVLAYEEGVLEEPARCVQRLAAWRERPGEGPRRLEPGWAGSSAERSAPAAPG